MARSSEPLENGRGITANLLLANINALMREIGHKKDHFERNGNRL